MAAVLSLCFATFLSTALQHDDIQKFFMPVFAQAKQLQQVYNSCDPAKKPNFRIPFVTVRFKIVDL